MLCRVPPFTAAEEGWTQAAPSTHMPGFSSSCTASSAVDVLAAASTTTTTATTSPSSLPITPPTLAASVSLSCSRPGVLKSLLASVTSLQNSCQFFHRLAVDCLSRVGGFTCLAAAVSPVCIVSASRGRREGLAAPCTGVCRRWFGWKGGTWSGGSEVGASALHSPTPEMN